MIASEDNRFCEHFGFDWKEMGGQLDRAMAGRAHARRQHDHACRWRRTCCSGRGAIPLRKLLEAVLTPQIELVWNKRRIMEVYLNVAETGPGMYGAEAAARGYFGKPASALTGARRP